MDSSAIGIIAFFVAFFASRLINERAMRRLDRQQAEALVKGFSRYYLISLGCVALLAAVYMTAGYYFPDHPLAAPAALASIVVAFMLLNSFLAFRKLKKMKMPDEYVNRFLIGTLIQYAGIFAFLYFSVSADGQG